jgi:DNA-binding transcriptional LysR family regulator
VDVRALQCFVAVARHRHFTRAADELYLTQSAVSQQVRRLEAELGAELVTRAPVALTPAGEALLPRAVAILAAFDDAHAAVTGTARGAVRVAAEFPAGLAPALARFHADHPEVRISLVDEGDVYVGASPPAGFAVEPLEAEPLVVLGRSAPTALADLKGQAMILSARASSVRVTVEEACAAAGFGPVPVLETADVAALRALVAAGAGVAVVPRSWAVGAEAAPLADRLLHEPVIGLRPGAPAAAELLYAALASSASSRRRGGAP